MWDTSIATWVGEETDWKQILIRHPPRKESATTSLMKMMRQPTPKEQKRWHSWQEAERAEHHGTRAPDDRQGVGVGNQRRQQDGGRLNQSRKAKKTPISTIAAQKQMRDWWCRGTDLRRRVADWQVHICREHIKEAGAWVGKGARGREEEWVDIANVVWSEVTGMCGF